MAIRVTVTEAQDRLEELVDASLVGNEVLIMTDGGVVRIEPIAAELAPR